MSRFCANCIEDELSDRPLERIGRYLLCERCIDVSSPGRELKRRAKAHQRSLFILDGTPDHSGLIRRLNPGEVIGEARSSVLKGLGGSHTTVSFTGLVSVRRGQDDDER